MTVADDLRAARKLIAVPERWTRHAAARDQNGNECGAVDNDACCWCALGAIWRVIPDDRISRAELALTRVVAPEFCGDIGKFNDDATHADILALFDRAIAAAEERAE